MLVTCKVADDLLDGLVGTWWQRSRRKAKQHLLRNLSLFFLYASVEVVSLKHLVLRFYPCMEIRGRDRKMVMDDALNAFSPVSTPRFDWKSRRRSASRRNLEVSVDTAKTPPTKQEDTPPPNVEMQDASAVTELELSERRKALFEPLEPIKNINGRRPSAESLLPPPDFDPANYPKGWLIGKKRKLVNVDVVESMRRIAIQEMNRKDREIDGLNEQLDEDSRCLEHLQIQLVEERSKRARVERDNAMLQEQVNMLMNMLQETEPMGDEDQDQEEP